MGLEFKLTPAPQGKGTVRIEYGKLNFEVGGTLTSDSTKSVIAVHGMPQIRGFKDGSTDEEFSLKIQLKMVYIYPAVEVLDENVLKENSWYFASFLKTYFKFYADGVINQSIINDIKLPFN